MLSALFRSEMQKLRSLVDEYLEQYPAHAALFGGSAVDPDVERLFEGASFLWATLSARLQDDWPELIHPLMQRVQPQWLRPTPSVAVMSFRPAGALSHPVVIPKGAGFTSPPVDGTTCRFVTCSDLVLHPCQLVDAAFIHPPGGCPSIRLSFSLPLLPVSAWKEPSLRLFLAGPFADAADLKLLLTRHLDHVELTAGDAPTCFLPGSSLTSFSDDPLYPVPSTFSGLGAALDYFVCPEMELFVELTGLDRWRDRGSGSRFEIRFVLRSDAPIAVPVIGPETFLLGATLAVNLFPHAGEHLSISGSEVKRLVPIGKEKGHARIWSVDEVIGRPKAGAHHKREYRDAYVCAEGDRQPMYRIRVRPRPVGTGIDLDLDLTKPDTAEETIAVGITCTDGDRPSRLRPGALWKRGSEIAEGLEIVNVTAPTPAAAPPLEPDRLWTLYTLARPCRQLLEEPEALRSALEALSESVRRDREGVFAAKARISGIEGTEVREKDFIFHGMAWRGIEVCLKLNPEAYQSLGDLYLFGSVIERFLGGFVSENALVRLVVTDSNGRDLYDWGCRRGERYKQ